MSLHVDVERTLALLGGAAEFAVAVAAFRAVIQNTALSMILETTKTTHYRLVHVHQYAY